MTNSRSKAMSNLEALHRRAKALNLHGLLAHWGEAAAAGWLATLIDWEEQERTRRSLERRLRAAHIGRFKPFCDFDWTWPKRCDRAAFEALMALLDWSAAHDSPRNPGLLDAGAGLRRNRTAL
jgi:hypothetical protein